ncbi:MAG TPA: alpha/beta fold hydrolase [Thermoleophilaceae bacterium]|jgi:alpha-beta hydrolase superfamily lysophospholipase|nr:alpha/beta fold hydrolase [Thermoleophilaceae bacterium]
MKHAPPAPPEEIGVHDGLAYALFVPDSEPECGVVILHGAGSAKESHFDFARLCRDSGLVALAFDARGHGRSEGPLGPGAVDDVLAMCRLIRRYADQVALRGSSMGAFCAIHAAARDPALAAVVAICPASEQLLLRGLNSGEPRDFVADSRALGKWLRSLDLYRAVAGIGPDTALLLLHARGDEQVPYTVSEELYAAAHEPKRLLLLPGGHHRSLQHDAEIQSISQRFIADAARRRRR